MASRAKRILFLLELGLIVGLSIPVGADPPSKKEAPPSRSSRLKMNQVQVIGTHNSYHQRPPERVLRLMKKVDRRTEGWDYEHAPLDVQLDRGVRSFELDIHYNPSEGFEVYHVPNLDNQTSCRKFTDCLKKIKDWSDRHRRHVPMLILVEFKDETISLDKRLRPLDEAALDRLDKDIREVFPAERLVTPDDVRGDAKTLGEAVESVGWPSLDSTRGKVFFVLHEAGKTRDLYAKGRPSLEGRAMFVRSEEGRADAAVMVVDQPVVERIKKLVLSGFIVRTIADGNVARDKIQSEKRRQRALASGAQVVSTDYPPGEPHSSNGYIVELPGAVPARVSPIFAQGKESEPVDE